MHKQLFLLTIICLLPWGLKGAGTISYPTERVYLQTDKTVYLSGEIIWLNLFCMTQDGLPSPLSKIGYIELLSDTTSKAQIMVNIVSSVGTGSLVIPTDIKSGNYVLTAYTRNMRNEGPDIFFKKNIAVVNPQLLEAPNNANEGNKVDAANNTNPIGIQTDNSVNIQTDAVIYNKRAKATIQLSNLPTNLLSASISVAGQSPLQVAGNLQLSEYQDACKNESHKTTPDVEKFTSLLSGLSTSDEHYSLLKDHLDSIKQIKSKHTIDVAFMPEYEGHIIIAKTKEAENTMDNIMPFIAFPGVEKRVFIGKKNEDGYEFVTKRISGYDEILLGKLTKNGIINDFIIEDPFADQHIYTATNPLYIDSAYIEKIQERSVGLQALYNFAQDSMRQFKEEKSYFNPPPHRTYITEEYTRFPTISDILTEYIPVIRFRRVAGERYLSVIDLETNSFAHGASLTLLDGIPIADQGIFYKYNADHIKKIDVYSGQYILGGHTFNGIVSFQTYQSNYPDLNLENNIRLFNYKTPQKERVFYMPDYARDNMNTLPDFRHTLVWIPRVQLEKNTPSTSIPFYTSDLVGKYDVIIEGITTDGHSIYAKSTFEVK